MPFPVLPILHSTAADLPRCLQKMHPAGIEPALPESESGVLSVRLRLQTALKRYVSVTAHLW